MVHPLAFLFSTHIDHVDVHHALSIRQNNFCRRQNVYETPTAAIFMDQFKRNSSGCFRKDTNIIHDYVVLIALQLTLSRILFSRLCRKTALGRLSQPCRKVVTGTVSIMASHGKATIGFSMKLIFTRDEMNISSWFTFTCIDTSKQVKND